MNKIIAGAAALAFSLGAAQATVLTFDQSAPDTPTVAGATPDSTYGDNVSSVSENGFTYGEGPAGFKPNITFDAPDARLWTNSYGGLTNIIYRSAVAQDLAVTLTADDGFSAFLFGFDLAGWPSTDYQDIDVKVFDQDNNELFSWTGTILGTNNGVTSFDFSGTPLFAQALQIVVFASVLGSANDNIGIDNITFGQRGISPDPVSVPGALPLFAGALFLGRRLMRRR